MGIVPQAYYDFILQFAPYLYVIPPDVPDPAYGKGVMSAAFAINFLSQAYASSQFASKQTEIRSKIVELADWTLTQQCLDPERKAYGGFKSGENSTYYYSVDAGRCIPALLEAYQITGNTAYLDAAKLAGGTFLKTMQDQQSFGGFARAVSIDDAWLLELDVECLYCLIGLQMLMGIDAEHASLYRGITDKAVAFLRAGFEGLWLYFEPSESQWHRVGLSENHIYDDSFSFALLGLFTYEGWSDSCKAVYGSLQGIKAAEYPAYNPAVGWPGYIDVKDRCPACAYYDDITSGILWRIRAAHDKPSLAFSMQIVEKYQNEFMNWGPLFTDYSPITPAKAMANVSWLAQLFLNYAEPATDLNQILALNGENLTLFPLLDVGDRTTYADGLPLKAIVATGTAGELVFEVGYAMQDYITVYSFMPLRVHDKVRRANVDYEVQTVQPFAVSGDPQYFKSVCRRLLGT